MKIKIVGMGAAGNKACVNAIEKGVISINQGLLLNSTMRDIPQDYKDIAVQYSNARGGAGKERAIARRLCLESIQDNTLNCLDKLIEDDDDVVVLVASTEGGTGSGTIPVLAKYYSKVIGIPVHCFVFTGFEEDSRGLQNTIEFFQEMEEDYTIQAISNKKFLEENNNNKLKAEKAANDEFVKRISILIGKNIQESDQNIDETDLFKVSTTPGYMTIGEAKLDRIKNAEQFNKIVAELIDSSKSLDVTDKTIKRLAIFLNISDRTSEIIDHNYTIFKDKLGVPYELFTHIQHNESQPESVSFIASGLNMPLEEVKDIYEKYKKEADKINTNKDNFFNFMGGIQKEEKKNELFKEMFNMEETIQQPRKEVSEIVKDKQSFVNDFGVSFRRKKTEPTIVNDAPTSDGERNKVKLTREDYLKNF